MTLTNDTFDPDRYLRSVTRRGDVKSTPIAFDIYERLEMQAEGLGGSVTTDIAGMDLEELEDYFGDTDPAEYL